MQTEYVCDKLMKIGYLEWPNYVNWLARAKWSVFEASCLVNGIEPFDFIKLKKLVEETQLSTSIGLTDIDIEVIKIVLSDTCTDKETMLTWIPEHARTLDPYASLEDPLKLINRHLLTVGNIPKELLMCAKKIFLLLYQSREASEDTRKNWKDNWHTIASPFKALIDKSTKFKQDISPRKEETLLALIGILIDKYYNGDKYKKGDGTHKSSTITEEIIDHVSKQLPSGDIPHGLKKSNLIEIISSSLECWEKKKER